MLVTVAHAAHVVGAVLFFVALGVEFVGLRLLRAASTPDQALLGVRVFSFNQLLGPLGLLLVLAPGVYLAKTVWAFVPTWIHVGFLVVVVVALTGGLLTGRTIVALRHDGATALAGKDSVALVLSFGLRAGLLVGALLMMAAKPDAVVDAALVVGGAVVGAGAALVARR